ncbi:MAG TPA: thioredoxin family protein [Chthoniobacteraceae bacterium]|nr:thioredoxin family protein [Chthoniobacteraceae bacterium]
MIRRLILLAALLATLGTARADEWLTDYKEAVTKAAEEKKPLLINFTGTNWCPPCIQLEKRVFSRKEFKEYAAKNLVLLKLEFPPPGQTELAPPPAPLRAAEPMTMEKLQENVLLAEQYRVEGYPTLLLISPKTKGPARITPTSTPGAFIESLEERLK